MKDSGRPSPGGAPPSEGRHGNDRLPRKETLGEVREVKPNWNEGLDLRAEVKIFTPNLQKKDTATNRPRTIVKHPFHIFFRFKDDEERSFRCREKLELPR